MKAKTTMRKGWLGVSSIILFHFSFTTAFYYKKCHNGGICRLFTRLQQINPQVQPSDRLRSSWLPPLLAVVTLPTACDSVESVQQTVTVLKEASGDSDNSVHVVYIRVPRPDTRSIHQSENLLVSLLNQLQTIRGKTNVFISSEWALIPSVWTRIQHLVDGIHVKEHHVEQMQQNPLFEAVPLGTSVHGIEAAVSALERIQPFYYFVGTCYPTASHPEKSDVEGPELPGNVVARLDESCQGSRNPRPAVFAIGGIDATNCHQPVHDYGADGVAVIRAVMQAADPRAAVTDIFERMRQRP